MTFLCDDGEADRKKAVSTARRKQKRPINLSLCVYDGFDGGVREDITAGEEGRLERRRMRERKRRRKRERGRKRRRMGCVGGAAGVEGSGRRRRIWRRRRRR